MTLIKLLKHIALASPGFGGGVAGRLCSAAEFRREIRRERLRADRRGIRFCVLKITLSGSSRRASEMTRLIRTVGPSVRATDEKAQLGRHVLGVLLVDTPEMGGRCALDRLEYLAIGAGLNVQMNLRVYDPESLGGDSEGDIGTDRGDSPLGGAAGRPTEQVPEPALASLLSRRSSFRPTRVVAAPASLRMAAKRIVDVVGALGGLVLAAPILAITVVAIGLTSKGPVVFRQVREGRGGRPFTIYKLRTMDADAESHQPALRASSQRNGPAFKLQGDPRVTPLGRFLRSTCIDELPQLINVLLGDMSLVGPRPLPWAESRACAAWQRRRLDVRPGLTCDWQINKRHVHTFDEWMRMDIAYVDRIGLWSDARLMARTMTVPLMGRGSD